MARKTKDIVIRTTGLTPRAQAMLLPEAERPAGWQLLPDELTPNRDDGKTFRITEMPALKAERWATRAFLALGRSGVDVPEELAAMGLRGLAIIGLRGLQMANYFELEPLLEEMMGCVQIVEQVGARTMTEDDIEEVSTILTLRKEVLGLHWDFFHLVLAQNSTRQPTTDVSTQAV